MEEISERTAELIDSVSEIVWAMNPKNDTLDNFIAHVRKYAVKYLGVAGIRCEFSAPDSIPAYHLPAEVRRNLFLVVKESLHNVVKHAEARKVAISAQLTDGAIRILVNDNGKGFTVGESQQSGNGLASMNKRIADIGGELEVESILGQGTSVEFVVRFQVRGN